MHTLFERAGHKNVAFTDLSEGAAVQANQHVIIDGGEAMLLDPGGHKVYSKLFSQVMGLVPPNGLKYVFFSHQDPDIVAAANGWLMVTEARALASSLWMRFIPHFGVDEYVVGRIAPVPDEGTIVMLNDKPLQIIAAHFLHSSGNLQVFDPVSGILYSGDMGTSVGAPYGLVEDFDSHVQYMDGFHRRYMPSTRALKLWLKTVRGLPIRAIAPQHGAMFGTPELSGKLLDWFDTLTVGADLLETPYALPG